MDPEEGEGMERGGEIRLEMDRLEQEVTACTAQATALAGMLEPVLRSVDGDTYIGPPRRGDSPVARRLGEQIERVQQLRFLIAQLLVACEL